MRFAGQRRRPENWWKRPAKMVAAAHAADDLMERLII
jgi:hypothetical protein